MGYVWLPCTYHHFPWFPYFCIVPFPQLESRGVKNSVWFTFTCSVCCEVTVWRTYRYPIDIYSYVTKQKAECAAQLCRGRLAWEWDAASWCHSCSDFSNNHLNPSSTKLSLNTHKRHLGPFLPVHSSTQITNTWPQNSCFPAVKRDRDRTWVACPSTQLLLTYLSYTRYSDVRSLILTSSSDSPVPKHCNTKVEHRDTGATRRQVTAF